MPVKRKSSNKNRCNSRKMQSGGSTKKSRKSKSNSRSKSRSKSKRRSKNRQRGGSPASNLVMNAKPNSYTSSCQMGGSDESDMVSSQMSNNSNTVEYPEKFNVSGNMNSLNTYKTTGGSRKEKSKKEKKEKRKKSKSKKVKNHKSKRERKSKSNNTKHVMRGGSDWISSQYSLGPINNPQAATNSFSAAEGVSHSTLMNPPNMGLAGSGGAMGELEGAGVRMTGSPLV